MFISFFAKGTFSDEIDDTKLFMMLIAYEEMPASGWTCLNTLYM